jgi:hypothetical protein
MQLRLHHDRPYRRALGHSTVLDSLCLRHRCSARREPRQGIPVLLQPAGQVVYGCLQRRHAGVEAADVLPDCGWSLYLHLLRESRFDSHAWPCHATWADAGKSRSSRPGERLPSVGLTDQLRRLAILTVGWRARVYHEANELSRERIERTYRDHP